MTLSKDDPSSRGSFLQRGYVRLFQAIGRLTVVRESRYGRYAFLRSLYLCEKWAGIPPISRWVALPGGSRFLCDLRDNVQAELFYLGSYSAPDIKILRERLRWGDCFLDVGAHVGLFSVELGKHVGPRGHVYAVEPAVDSVRLLQLHAQVNNVSNVTVVDVALGERAEHALLRRDAQNPNDAGRRSLSGTGSAIQNTKVCRLDDLVASGIVRLDKGLHAVKIDVEGAEVSVVRGMSEVLSEFRPHSLLIEVSQESLIELDKILKPLGYIRFQPNQSRVTSGRNILFISEA